MNIRTGFLSKGDSQEHGIAPLSINIVLVDDSHYFCGDLHELVINYDNLGSVRQAHSANEALKLLDTARTDLVILDLVKPGADGFDLTKQIKQAYPDVRVVILTLHDTAEYRFLARNAGADGFISRNTVDADFAKVIGRLFISPRPHDIDSGDTSVHTKALAVEALFESKERLNLALEAGGMGVWNWNVQSGLISWSEQLAKIFELGANEFDCNYQELVKRIHPDDLAGGLSGINRARDEKSLSEHTFRIITHSGQHRWVTAKGHFYYDDDGQAIRMTGVISDVTELVQRKRTAADQAAYLRAIFDESVDCIFTLDTTGHIQRINPAGRDMLEDDLRDEITGASILRWIPSDYQEQFLAVLKRVWSGTPERLEFELLGFKGTRRWLEMSASRVFLPHGQNAILAVTRDITERKTAQDKLSYLAQHDALTGLPNRRLFKDRLNQAMIEAERHDRLVGVVILDLDDFKDINDTLGHQAGDKVLIELGNRLTKVLRNSDTVARHSGDEFAVVLADMAHLDDVAAVLEKLVHVFERPIVLNKQELFVTASIGVTMYPVDDGNADLLLRNADIAMYRHKQNKQNGYEFYSSEMTDLLQQRTTMEQALRHAVERNELIVHYQPQLELRTGKITGVEALVRWNHPDLGLVPPGDFIPLAEDTGLILPIGEWVLRQSAQQVKQWQSQGHELRVAVNFSSRQFRQSDVLDVVSNILDEFSLDARYMELELTESVLINHADDTLDTLKMLNDIGVQLSIDDFGTGYSSLSYLKKFPISVLKIDRSFVRDINDNPEDAAIVLAIIKMAHTLGMRVVAEGVENIEQLRFLRDHDCDLMQGFYFSKPLPAEQVTDLLNSNKALALIDDELIDQNVDNELSG